MSLLKLNYDKNISGLEANIIIKQQEKDDLKQVYNKQILHLED